MISSTGKVLGLCNYCWEGILLDRLSLQVVRNILGGLEQLTLEIDLSGIPEEMRKELDAVALKAGKQESSYAEIVPIETGPGAAE